MAIFLVVGFQVSVRLDVQRLRKEMDQIQRREREAQVLNERLRLELDARRRASAVEALAAAMGLKPATSVVEIEERR